MVHDNMAGLLRCVCHCLPHCIHVFAPSASSFFALLRCSCSSLYSIKLSSSSISAVSNTISSVAYVIMISNSNTRLSGAHEAISNLHR